MIFRRNQVDIGNDISEDVVIEGAKDAACTRSHCSIRSGSTNGINSPCPLSSGQGELLY